MEKSIDIYSIIADDLKLEKKDISGYSPLTLAYLGDAVYELVIRTKIVSEGNSQVNKLHHKSAALVKAETQARLIKCIMDDLSEEETAVYKRGRNAKSYTSAKHASISDYRTATGFETLVGYLYMTGQTGRMNELIVLALAKLENEDVNG